MNTMPLEDYDPTDTSAAPIQPERPVTRQQRRATKGKKNLKRFINGRKYRK